MNKNYLEMPLQRLNKMYIICGMGGTLEDLPGPITDNDRAFWEDVVLETQHAKEKGHTIFLPSE